MLNSQFSILGRLFFIRLSGCVSLLFCISGLSAYEVRESSNNYMVDRWGVEDGLPGSQMLSIAQTSDGYIWVGTYYGLARFDGMGFTVFDSQTEGLPSGPTFSLAAGRNGDLWILKQRKLVHYSQGKFKTVHDYGAEITESVFYTLNFVGITNTGAPILGIRIPPISTVMIFIYEKGESRILFNHQFTDEKILWPNLDSSDQIWIGVGQRFGIVSGDKWHPISDLASSKDGKINITPSKSGGFWGKSQGQIHRFLDNSWKSFPVEEVGEFKGLNMGMVIENPDGSIWVKTKEKKFLQFELNETSQLMAGDVIDELPGGSLMIDFAGQIWVASRDSEVGLTRYRERTFWNYNKIPELKGVIRCFAQRSNGDLLINLMGGLVGIPEAGFSDLRHLSKEVKVFNRVRAWTMFEDSRGRSLIGLKNLGNLASRKTLDKGSLIHRDPNDNTHELFPNDIGMEYRISAICEGEKGEIWVSCDSSELFKIVGGSLVKFDGREVFGIESIHCLAVDGKGGVWIGSRGNGLIHFSEGKIKKYLEKLQVRTLLNDDEGTLWVGTSGSGIFRFQDEVIFQFNRSHGLPVNDSNTILDDGLGSIWFGSYRGVHRIRKRNFDLVSSGKSQHLFPNSFTLADGLSSMQCSTGHPAGFRTRDGKLWFATVSGVNVVDPKTVNDRQVVYDPIIEHVLVDGKEAELAANSLPIVVGPSSSRVEFRYSAISLDNPTEIRFRYRLKGHEEDWVDAGRQRSVAYGQLDAGNFIFEVMAADNYGDWSGEIAEIPLLVQGPIWKSTSFQVTALLGMLSLASGLVYMRSRRQAQRLEARKRFTKDVIDNQETDRRRIARELHDSLEQNLLVIKNQAILSSQKQGVDSDLRSKLEDISEISSSSIEEVRLIANNLRPYQIDRLGLSKAIDGMLNKVCDSSGLEIERLIDDIPKSVSSDLQMNVYRIIQEILNNTLKHAEASKVILTLIIGENTLSLQVKDDGKGFKVEGVNDLLRIEGHGLRGIEERVSLFNGRCELHSSIGSGTEWDIRIPLR